MLYKGLKSAASILTHDLVTANRRARNHHSLIFHTLLVGTDMHKSSCKRLVLPGRFNISASECVEDSVTKFTSLIRARERSWPMIIFERITS